MFRMLKTIPPQKAEANEVTVKPGTSAEASSIIAAFTTSQKIPSVRMVSGNVMILRKNPRVALIKPMNTAAISAAAGPLTRKPGTNRETIQIASALKSQCRSNLNLALPLSIIVRVFPRSRKPTS